MSVGNALYFGCRRSCAAGARCSCSRPRATSPATCSSCWPAAQTCSRGTRRPPSPRRGPRACPQVSGTARAPRHVLPADWESPKTEIQSNLKRPRPLPSGRISPPPSHSQANPTGNAVLSFLQRTPSRRRFEGCMMPFGPRRAKPAKPPSLQAQLPTRPPTAPPWPSPARTSCVTLCPAASVSARLCFGLRHCHCVGRSASGSARSCPQQGSARLCPDVNPWSTVHPRACQAGHVRVTVLPLSPSCGERHGGVESRPGNRAAPAARSPAPWW